MASAVAVAIRETEAREQLAQAMQQLAATQAEILARLTAIEAALTAPTAPEPVTDAGAVTFDSIARPAATPARKPR